MVRFAFGVLLAACSSTGAASSAPAPDSSAVGPSSDGVANVDAGAVECPKTPEPTCEAPIDVATAEQAFAVIESIPIVSNPHVRPAAGVVWRPTRDVRFMAATDLEGTLATQRRPDCGQYRTCPNWAFVVENGLAGTFPAGVSCALEATPQFGCARLHVDKGVVLRFQSVVTVATYENTMSRYVRVVRACPTACALTEHRCEASTVCLAKDTEYCSVCRGLDPEVCTCQSGCGPKQDSTTCKYFISDHVSESGTCSAGVCKKKKF